MSDPLPGYAELLNQVADICSVLVDPAVVAVPGSPGDRELRTARDRDGGAEHWSEEPIRAAYALAAINYSAALDHAGAMASLLTGRFTPVPVMALGRCLIEASSRAWWLLEPDIGVVARVERYQVTRYVGAIEDERATLDDGIPADQVGLHIQTPTEIEDYSRRLGLTAMRRDGRTYVCGSQRLPSISRRVIDMFGEIDIPSIYRIYSAFSHGELRALQQGFRETITPDGHRFYRPVINEDVMRDAVTAASWALYPPAARITTLFGLDQGRMALWEEKHSPTLDQAEQD